MQLTEGNRWGRRGGAYDHNLITSTSNIGSSNYYNVNSASHAQQRLNSASVNVGNNIANNSFYNFVTGETGGVAAGNADAGGGGGNQADDI